MIEVLLLIAFGYAIGWVINHPEEAKKLFNKLVDKLGSNDKGINPR